MSVFGLAFILELTVNKGGFLCDARNRFRTSYWLASELTESLEGERNTFISVLLIFTRFSLPVLDDFTDKDMKSIERIYKNVLMTTKSREQQKALVKKYVGWVIQQSKIKTENGYIRAVDRMRTSFKLL